MRVRILEREFQERPITCMSMLSEGREPPGRAGASKALQQTCSSSRPVVKEKKKRSRTTTAKNKKAVEEQVYSI